MEIKLQSGINTDNFPTLKLADLTVEMQETDTKVTIEEEWWGVC